MAQENDLVLVYMDDKPAFFARIELISADIKPDWFHLKMLVLQVPPVLVTWILRSSYIDGQEFTMGGRPVRIEKVVSPEEDEEIADVHPKGPVGKEETPPEPAEKGKVISLRDRRKKDQSS